MRSVCSVEARQWTTISFRCCAGVMSYEEDLPV